MSSPQQERALRKELQGPRPAPLKISRESHKVRKPPMPAPVIQYRPPVIIYTHSPKIIHTEAGEFMTLVQRLTGRADNNNNKIQNPYAQSHPPEKFRAADASRFQAIQTAGVRFENPNYGRAGLSETEIPSGNPNWSSVDAPPELSKQESGYCGSNSADVSSVNAPPEYSPLPSLPSPNFPSGLFSPLSPSLFMSSPRLFSPNLFQDCPLFTPDSENFFSPRHMIYRQSEAIFTPPFRPPLGAFSSAPSPSPGGYELFNNRPDC